MHTKTASLLVITTALTAMVVFVRAADPQPATASAPSLCIPLQLNQPIDLDLKSDDVKWQGNTFQLLRFFKAEFNLDDNAHLTTTLYGSSISFDDVKYTVHAAVFDKTGRLMGTASAPYRVQRIWLGGVVTTQVELEMDFGISNTYTDVAAVTFAISSMEVLTPDQWQDE
jgi:hypothetical protein